MKTDRTVWKSLALVTQIGISMLTPIFLCVFIGYQLDKHVQRKIWLIIFLVLGILAAFRNVYYITKQFYAKDKAREDEQLEYIRKLKEHKSNKPSSKTDDN